MNQDPSIPGFALNQLQYDTVSINKNHISEILPLDQILRDIKKMSKSIDFQ